jgi:hypothetical protein
LLLGSALYIKNEPDNIQSVIENEEDPNRAEEGSDVRFPPRGVLHGRFLGVGINKLIEADLRE